MAKNFKVAAVQLNINKKINLILDDIKHYMFGLLSAIKHLSDHGIMHRDLKPSNYLYDPETRTGLLIDFGLSEI